MKPVLVFCVVLPYVQTEFEELKKLSLQVFNMGSGRFQWFFEVKDISRVVEVLGKKVEFLKEDINYVVPYCPCMEVELESKARKKGVGEFEIVYRSPKIYKCRTTIGAKTTFFEVPVENIMAAWDVVKSYPLGKDVKASTVAERIVTSLGLTRFNRLESGSFDWQKFFGCRKEYYLYYYAPVKVLQAEGVLAHGKTGLIRRLSSEWVLQSVFDEDVLRSDEI